ncbi:hypothetical protein [Rhizobium sp. ARZ01]|nr:hypothetical protein [Rhizobium sp. ARZ01]
MPPGQGFRFVNVRFDSHGQGSAAMMGKGFMRMRGVTAVAKVQKG